MDPKTGAVILTPGSDRYNGLVIPGTGFPDSAKGRFPEANGAYDFMFRGGKTPSQYSNIHYDQFQPRLGIAYQLTPSTVIRTGAGRFYTRLGVSDSIFLGGNPPFQPTANVSFGNVDNPGGVSANSLPLTVTTQSKEFKNPEAWNWNLTVEREIPGKSVVTVRLCWTSRPAPAARSQHQSAHPRGHRSQPRCRNLDALRPYKGYNSIRETDNVSRSMYNSLQLSWNKTLLARLHRRRLLHALQEHGLRLGPARHYSQHL